MIHNLTLIVLEIGFSNAVENVCVEKTRAFNVHDEIQDNKGLNISELQ